MHQNDYEPFVHLLEAIQNTLGGGPDFSDKKVADGYWYALKDLSFQAIERATANHMRYHKFFPKPVELRPADERQQPVATSFDEIKTAEIRHLAYCDDYRARDPIGFALWFNVELCKRHMDTVSYDGHDWRKECVYWQEIARRPIEQQRAALPTFAAEADMTPAERQDRMRYIREARPRGVKANSLAFAVPRASVSGPSAAIAGPA